MTDYIESQLKLSAKMIVQQKGGSVKKALRYANSCRRQESLRGNTPGVEGWDFMIDFMKQFEQPVVH